MGTHGPGLAPAIEAVDMADQNTAMRSRFRPENCQVCSPSNAMLTVVQRKALEKDALDPNQDLLELARKYQLPTHAVAAHLHVCLTERAVVTGVGEGQDLFDPAAIVKTVNRSIIAASQAADDLIAEGDKARGGKMHVQIANASVRILEVYVSASNRRELQKSLSEMKDQIAAAGGTASKPTKALVKDTAKTASIIGAVAGGVPPTKAAKQYGRGGARVKGK